MYEPRRVLVVDDEAPITELIADALQDEGYIVHTTTSGIEALAMLEDRATDLIMLDAYMPGMSGKELLAHIRSHPGHAQVPIIVMSASAPAADSLAHYPTTTVLLKPFDIDVLIDLVATTLAAEQKRQ